LNTEIFEQERSYLTQCSFHYILQSYNIYQTWFPRRYTYPLFGKSCLRCSCSHTLNHT